MHSPISRRRPETTFAFGMFGVQSGFAVSHQYDRVPSIIRPGDPVMLRVHAVPEYQSVTAFVLEGDGPFTQDTIRDEGVAVPFNRSGDGWVATLFGRPDRTTAHYIIEAHHRSGTNHYGDGRLPLTKARVFTHRTTSRRPPKWTEDAIVYQIFVDRFANAGGVIDTPANDHDWAGGDLHGVTANLDWLSDLGINCLWLTPIFTCHSYHGYDAIDMNHVDPRFGGDEALRTLINEAHARGIRVLLDIVPNHISHLHPWFVAALNGGPEREWFFFDDDDDNDSYRTFFASVTMPKLNLDHPDARMAMLDVAGYWVEEFGIDGYRIDHALGPTESFFAALTSHMEQIDPDIWMFGEVTATAQLVKRYGGILDGVTDFPYAYGLRELLAGHLSNDAFAEIERESAAVLSPSEFSWVRFFDNHDMARAIHGWQNDHATLVHALEILLGLPGVPSFFYGTEQALTHERPETEGGLSVGRVPMTFDATHELVETTRRLVSRRVSSSNDQATPIYWDVDGSSWLWGDLGCRLQSDQDGGRPVERPITNSARKR